MLRTQWSDWDVVTGMDRLAAVALARARHAGLIDCASVRDWLTDSENAILNALERKLLEHNDGRLMLRNWNRKWKSKLRAVV